MTQDAITDETLTALADGELDAAAEAALRDRMASDPALAERFALFAETRALLAPAATAAAGDAGLARLAAAIRAADQTALKTTTTPTTTPKPRLTVIEGAGRPAKPVAARPSRGVTLPIRGGVVQPSRTPVFNRSAFSGGAWRSALAACLALVVGGGLGYVAGLNGGGSAGDAGGIAVVAQAPAAERAIRTALEGGVSGAAADWSDAGSGLSGQVSVIATQRVGDGRFCREYEVVTTGAASKVVAVSCRGANGAWATEMASSSPVGGDGYGTASGESLAERRLADMGGAGALSEIEEKAALATRWAGPPR